MSGRSAWLPSSDQELLLRAALLRPGDTAERAWARWREGHPDGHFDVASFRLLPLVYRNLAAAGSADPWMGRLKGIYRRSWFLNQTLLNRAADVVGHLESAGIPTLLLKGAGLTLEHYRDMGTRPMDDVDVAVPAGREREAMAELQRHGLTPEFAIPADAFDLRHAETMIAPGGHRFDVHWSLLWQAGDDDGFWDAAVPVKIGSADVLTRTLSPTDHVLHVCAHGTYWSKIHPLRWVADVHAVLAPGSVAIDWERLVRMAAERELTLPLQEALAYVGGQFDVAVPEDVLARLRRQPVRRLRRAAHGAAGLPPSLQRSGALSLLYLDMYRSRARLRGQRPGPRGFIRYLQRQLRVDGPRELAGRIARSILHGTAPGGMPVVARRPDPPAETGPRLRSSWRVRPDVRSGSGCWLRRAPWRPSPQ